MATQKELPPLKILVDMREKRSGVCTAMQRLGAEIEHVDLAAADYIVGEGVGVERKEATDFVLSIMDGRLMQQARLLKAYYERPIILIEGNIYQTRSAIAPEALNGALSYLAVIEGITLMQARDSRHSAELLYTFARHSQQGLGYEISLRRNKPKDPATLAQFLIEGLPGVGPGGARRMLAHFGSARKMLLAEKIELGALPGVGPKTVQRILEVIDFDCKE